MENSKNQINNFNDMDEKHQHLSPQRLKKLLALANNLRQLIESNRIISKAELDLSRSSLLELLYYLRDNNQDPSLDYSLIPFLENLLGIAKDKEKDHEKSFYEKEYERLEEEFEQYCFRMAIYEIYKITNPNQLAGETEVENFLNNVRLRGLSVARMYDGKQFENKFSEKSLLILESYSHPFKMMLDELSKNITNTLGNEKTGREL